MYEQELAARFAGCKVVDVGLELGTEYAGSGREMTHYFESEDGQKIVVHYDPVQEKYSVDRSDSFAWEEK